MCEIDLRLRGLSGALACKPSIQNNPTPSPPSCKSLTPANAPVFKTVMENQRAATLRVICVPILFQNHQATDRNPRGARVELRN